MSHVTYMNEECREWVMSRIWMSHVTCELWAILRFEWVMSHTHEWVNLHICMSPVTHVNAHVNEWCDTCNFHFTHIWMSHVTHVNESCHTWVSALGNTQVEWVMSRTHALVMSHTSMSHVSHMNESRLTYKWVTSHTWMSHVTHVNESRPTHVWVTSHMWMSPVTLAWVISHTYKWVMSHIWMSHVVHLNESCHAAVIDNCKIEKLFVEGGGVTQVSHVTHINESRHTHKRVTWHICISHGTHTSGTRHTCAWVMAHKWFLFV